MIFPLYSWKNRDDKTKRLESCRRELRRYLGLWVDQGLVERLTLAAHEIIGNIFIHSDVPRHIMLELDTIGGQDCWVIRDDGRSFHDFNTVWSEVAVQVELPIMDQSCRGLAIVARLWPKAYYQPQLYDRYNRFVLPLVFTNENVPGFFQSLRMTSDIAKESRHDLKP